MPGRIVVVGEPAPGGLGSSIISAFTMLGRSVGVVDWGPWRPAQLASAAFQAPRLAGGFRRRLRQEVDRLAGGDEADLVQVIKEPLLDTRTIEHFRKRMAAPVVCWNPDSPFDGAVSNRGAGIPSAIGAYDTYVTWADDVAERLALQSAHVIVVPFAWDSEIHRPTAGRGLTEGRIVFVGTGSKERVELMRKIAHLRPLVFGNQWPAIEGVEIHPPAVGVEMSAIVGEAQWNLNPLRPQNARSHNTRTFEVPGAGGNQLAPHTGDHERFLGSDSRTLLFHSHGELESILRSDPAELAPRQDDLLTEHTYVARVRKLLTEVGLTVD